MNEEYIIGRISVIFAGFKKEIVQLEFNVQGRMASVSLDNGDLIEVIDQEPVIAITTDEILDSFDNQEMKISNNHNSYLLDTSYQGRKVRVKLNPETTKRIQKKAKDYAITQLFKSVEAKSIKASEAMEIIKQWETMDEEDGY